MRPPLICTVIIGPSFEEALEQIRGNKQYSSLFELRIDLFRFQDDLVSQLMQEADYKVLLTLRSRSQGGSFEGDPEKRLLSLASLKPCYLDFEDHLPDALLEKILSSHPDVQVIISNHIVANSQIDLCLEFSRLSRRCAAFYKLAVNVSSSCEAIYLALQAQKISAKFLFVPIGLDASCGRLFSKPYTFAASGEGKESASGQMTAKILFEDYKLYRQGFNTFFALIGDPITHSIGHRYHNEQFERTLYPALYFKVRIAKEGILDFLSLASKLSLKGFSVTMPLKEVVMDYLDSIDEEALKIGAVNTVIMKEGKWIGFNTDGLGALNALEKYGAVKGCKLLIVGTGGAAKAIGFEASKRGAILSIYSRNPEKSTCLMSLEEAIQSSDVVINCTPAPLKIEIPKDVQLMDIRVGSSDCTWLNSLKQRGQIVIGWQEMFLEQAVLQSKIFHS